MVFASHIVSKRRFTLNGKEALYAVIGGIVGAALTLAVCSFFPLGAQSLSDSVFDTVTCSRLRVVDSEGRLKVKMFVKNGDGGGGIGVLDKEGIPVVGLDAGEHGGNVVVFKKGRLNAQASMSVDENGGRVSVAGKGSQTSQASMAVTSSGSGGVFTWDKNGKRLHKLGD